MNFSFQPMTQQEAAEIAEWRYEDVCVAPLLGRNDDFTAMSELDVVGYCSFGRNAMIPRFLDEEHFVGVAWGLQPDLVGHGNGRKFIESVVAFGTERYRPRVLQACIKESNARSLRAAKNAGFIQTAKAGEYVVLHT